MKTTAYDTAAILRQNVADLEKQLQQQQERHSAATARLRDQIERVTSEWEMADKAVAEAREDLQVWIDSRNEWMARAEKAEAELKELREQEPATFVHDPNGTSIGGTHIEIADALPLGTDLYTRPIPAPAPAVPDEWREVMAGLIAIAGKKGKKQGSPNHYHKRPGIWDDDNGQVLSGKPCAECAMYDKARALLQSGGGRQPAPAVPEEWLKCWLIERPASTDWPAIWLTITTDGRRFVYDGGTLYATGGHWHFTTAASEALKFADKESADEYVRHDKIKDVVVTEHIFDKRALLQSGENHD